MLPQHRDEAPPEILEKVKFNIAKWPVNTDEAKAALADIMETHFIRTPPIYDIPGQLVKPIMYPRRFRGAIAVIKFAFSFYKWGDKNTFCADLVHLRILVTPSPLSPVTPRYKRAHVVDYDPEFPIFQPDLKAPDLKKPKIQDDAKGITAHGHLRGPQLILPAATEFPIFQPDSKRAEIQDDT